MSVEEYLLFWTNFKEYLKVNPCAIEFESPSHQPHQISKLRGYDLEIDLCANSGKSSKNGILVWNFMVLRVKNRLKGIITLKVN